MTCAVGKVISETGRTLVPCWAAPSSSFIVIGRRDFGVDDLFSAASPFILPLIDFGILFGIGVTFGLILLVVPGLILLTFWLVGAPAIVVEGIGLVDDVGRSQPLVRGNAWAVFGALLVLLIVILLGALDRLDYLDHDHGADLRNRSHGLYSDLAVLFRLLPHRFIEPGDPMPPSAASPAPQARQSAIPSDPILLLGSSN